MTPRTPCPIRASTYNTVYVSMGWGLEGDKTRTDKWGIAWSLMAQCVGIPVYMAVGFCPRSMQIAGAGKKRWLLVLIFGWSSEDQMQWKNKEAINGADEEQLTWLEHRYGRKIGPDN